MARMPIQQHHVDELKRIYRDQYSAELSDKEAWAMARRLVSLFRLLSNGNPGPVGTQAKRENRPGGAPDPRKPTAPNITS